ncbi:TonB-dependent receptor domain-containing protein [Pedobacter sp. NJ-S-72]
MASYSNSELITQQFTNTLTFNKEIASKLNLNAIIGYEFNNYTNKGQNMTGRGFGDAAVDYTDIFHAIEPANRTVNSYNDPVSQLQSYFARAIFNYDNKYLLTATFRADGSTKFGSNNRYGYFPSFAAAWNIKNETFMADVSWLNQLKLRAGYGKTGNQEFPSGASSQQRFDYVFIGGKRTLVAVNNRNPDLKWQEDEQTNLGVDFGLFGNKITGSVDYFNKKKNWTFISSKPSITNKSGRSSLMG